MFKKPGPYDQYVLEIRRDIINKKVLQRQDLILQDIVDFNDALLNALREMYDAAYKMFDEMKQLGYDEKEITVRAQCSLEYPKNHPMHSEEYEEFWGTMCDSELNPLYAFGFAELCIRDGFRENRSFEDFVGFECPPPNWNEGLDSELTKDLHLCMPFHSLFEHTGFAITDFIYCRDFSYEITVERTTKVKNAE